MRILSAKWFGACPVFYTGGCVKAAPSRRIEVRSVLKVPTIQAISKVQWEYLEDSCMAESSYELEPSRFCVLDEPFSPEYLTEQKKSG